MKNLIPCLLSSTALALVSCGSTGSVAEGNIDLTIQNEGKATPDESAQVVEEIAAARLVARWAEENGNPMVLAGAAAMLKAMPAGGSAPEQVSGGGEVEPKESGVARDSAQDYLDRASEMANADPALMAMIDGIASERSRGRVQGPGTCSTNVLANDTDIFTEDFRGGEYARVIVDGDGDTDLDLFIYDENGNLIDSDTDMTDYCVCSWTPRWTGSFRIEVRNLGSVYNHYTLTTN